MQKIKTTQINKLVQENNSCFARHKYDIGKVTCYEAHIDLITNKYCSKRPHGCTITDRQEIEQQVAKLLEKKVIGESYNPFAAPVINNWRSKQKKIKTPDCAQIFET